MLSTKHLKYIYTYIQYIELFDKFKHIYKHFLCYYYIISV